MAMTLQQAIDYVTNPPVPTPNGIEVDITISMHDDSGTVLVGDTPNGRENMFRPDLPLLNYGSTTFTVPGAPTRTRTGGLFGTKPAPGFSTRGLGNLASMRVIVGTGVGTSAPGTLIPIDFSVRKNPGIAPWASVLGLGPSVQIEIETLSAPGGTATGGIKLDPVEENGALLRAVGQGHVGRSGVTGAG